MTDIDIFPEDAATMPFVPSPEDVRKWWQLITHDPRIAWLLTDARAQVVVGTGTYCRIEVFKNHFAPRIALLCGPKSVNNSCRVLRSPLTYEYVSRLILSALPPCRGCKHRR